MTTYDWTGDGDLNPPDPHWMRSQKVCYHRRIVVADVIASDATMTSNGYIATDDILQLIDVPIGFVFDKAMFRIITACTDAADAEVGLDGGAEGVAALGLDDAAGTCTTTVEGDTWAGGKVFYAADTIDAQFIDADVTDGVFELFVFGWLCQLGAA